MLLAPVLCSGYDAFSHRLEVGEILKNEGVQIFIVVCEDACDIEIAESGCSWRSSLSCGEGVDGCELPTGAETGWAVFEGTKPRSA